MIAYLNGTILNKGKGFAIIRVSDVGYKVFLNPTMLAEIVVGQELELYTHQYVREDSLDLFGFSSVSELELFELLISVSGVGPKSALGVLSVAGPEDIKNSIMRGDSHLLTKVSGIGKKTAERIVLELREKVGNLESGIGNKEIGGSISASGDEIDALIALGYGLMESREALRFVDPKFLNSGDRIREALRKLAK